MKRFFDTCSLLTDCSDLSDVVISSKTIEELENIKTGNRSDDIKYKARMAVRAIKKQQPEVRIVTLDTYDRLKEFNLEPTNDNLIIASAYEYNLAYRANKAEEAVFYTEDYLCGLIAEKYFYLKVKSIKDDLIEDDYTGFVEHRFEDDDLAYFYEHLDKNVLGLLKNQYLIIVNEDNEPIDTYRWNGETHVPLSKKSIKSMYFDKLKTKDVYQSCAVDSLLCNIVTAISGKAGSGKSLLSLMAAMYLIESGSYDRIVVMFNPTKSRGASDMGAYKGNFQDKAMQCNIGQILTTKFGDRYIVDSLIQQEKIKLVSMADARGMEIKDNEILWITESQNTTIDLIKLCLSRVSSGAKIFLEGDYSSQTDSKLFEGNNNGLKRVIEAFRGQDVFGYIQLQNVWRSKIAELCELL